jgi:outer membrane protein OmpA-like peptidoglycan-associated protein
LAEKLEPAKGGGIVRHVSFRVAAAAIVAVLWSSAAHSHVTLGSYVGAAQQSMGRAGHVWAVGLTSGGSVALDLGERWRLRFGLGWTRLWDDTSSTALIKFANRTTETTRAWTTTSLRVSGEFRPGVLEHLGSYLSVGIGTASWDVRTYPDYLPVEIVPSQGEPTEFRATELLLLGGFGIEPAISTNVHARIGVQADYFSGIGASVPAQFADDRSHVVVGLTFGLSYRFGAVPGAEPRTVSEPLIIRPEKRSTTADASSGDRDSVPATADTETPSPTKPESPPAQYLGPTTGELFASLVPESRRRPKHFDRDNAARLTQPREFADSDGDGIIDAIDRCPNTPKGFSVDVSGCMKLTAQADGFVLRVDYASGGTDPDSVSLLILDDLVTRLKGLPDVSVLVEGHTDNIGTDLDNLLLSQKRASKVKDYLVASGISPDRINAIGRGEAMPIASNGTASGRKANRRIEISYQQSFVDSSASRS